MRYQTPRALRFIRLGPILADVNNAMYQLFLKLSADPRLIDAYRGALPCAILAALAVDDDENFTAASRPELRA
jgi:hypothetical protein